jgi:hypothetical protein
MRLWDALEERFASEDVRERVAALGERTDFQLDARRKGKLLALEVGARVTSADQKFLEVTGPEDEGIDAQVEFTDDNGNGTGRRAYLQLKAGNSHLRRRKSDRAEVFHIRKQRWVRYWMQQDGPVILVIGSLPEEGEAARGGSGVRFSEIRWMEIGEYLRRESEDGTRLVREIVFVGQNLDVMSVRGWRSVALSAAIETKGEVAAQE